jgi:predicted dehydrogenase
MHASWISRGGMDIQLTLFGADGTLHLDSTTPLTLRRQGEKPTEVDLPADVPNLYTGFVEAVATGAPLPVSAADGRNALAIIEAVYKSVGR